MQNYYKWLQSSRASAIAQDADFKEEDHPRNEKGGTGGGRFRTSGKTIEKEDEIGDGQSYVRKPLFEVGQRVKFRDPEFEDGDVFSYDTRCDEWINLINQKKLIEQVEAAFRAKEGENNG